MKALASVALFSAISACGGGVIRFQTTAAGPPPPPPMVAGEAPVATAEVSVEAGPDVTTSDPEELTVTTEPPDPIYEEENDAPGSGYVWVGGSWAWTGTEWAWYSGRWLMAPEGRVYVEPYYERVGPNVVYVRGYWGTRDAPHRSYGGERIRFAAPARPADYRRGERPRVERRPGVQPGRRPATFYEHAAGPVRPVPRTTQPSYRPASRETPVHAPPGGEAAGHVGAGHDRTIEPKHDVDHPSPSAPRGAAPGQGPDPMDRGSGPPREGAGRDNDRGTAPHGAPTTHAPPAPHADEGARPRPPEPKKKKKEQ
jgi:hypothetical protein